MVWSNEVVEGNLSQERVSLFVSISCSMSFVEGTEPEEG